MEGRGITLRPVDRSSHCVSDNTIPLRSTQSLNISLLLLLVRAITQTCPRVAFCSLQRYFLLCLHISLHSFFTQFLLTTHIHNNLPALPTLQTFTLPHAFGCCLCSMMPLKLNLINS